MPKKQELFMRELTMDGLSMRELNAQEVQLVSGGWTPFGLALAVGGVLLGIAGAVLALAAAAPVLIILGAAAAITGAGLAGFGVIYDATYDAIHTQQQSTPVGTITIEELQQTNNTPTESAVDTTAALAADTDYNSAVADVIGDMSYISSVDQADYGTAC
jgi:lactobin A/cerein 7B family class IIb bacteriocin